MEIWNCKLFQSSGIRNKNMMVLKKISRNDMYVVKQSNKQILVKKDGSEVLNTGYDEIKEILKKC